MINTVLKVLVVILVLGLVLAGGYFWFITSVFDEWNEDTWQVEKQILRKEYFSPDSTYKIGLYQYDSGALGYTAIQMSIVERNKKYPLQGNILMINRRPPTVEWISTDSVYVRLDTSNTPGFRIEPYKRVNNVSFCFEIE